MMLRRLTLVAVCLAAVVCLCGCVFKGEGRKGVYTKTGPTRVYNVRQRSYPHSHSGGSLHSHVGGDQRHNHSDGIDDKKRYGNRGKHKRHHQNRHPLNCTCNHCNLEWHDRGEPTPPGDDWYEPPARNKHDDPNGYEKHEDDDHGNHGNHGNGHDHGKGKGKGKGHEKGKGKGHDKD